MSHPWFASCSPACWPQGSPRLTASPTIDAARLGAEYIAITQIQRDEAAQTRQLTPTVRGVLSNQQQLQLAALENAASLNYTASEAVNANILVLPPDLRSSTTCFPNNVIPSSGKIVPVGGVVLPYPNRLCAFSNGGFTFAIPQ
jgi:hypothetical protein